MLKLTMRALNMICGDLADLTELSPRCSFTVFFNPLKSVGGAYVLVPIYLIELNACGTRPISANLCLRISSGFLEVAPDGNKQLHQ